MDDGRLPETAAGAAGVSQCTGLLRQNHRAAGISDRGGQGLSIATSTPAFAEDGAAASRLVVKELPSRTPNQKKQAPETEENEMSEVLVTPSELPPLMASQPTVLIDTRGPASYAAGHIPGAANIHEIFTYLATSTPEGFAGLRETFATAFGKAGLPGKETAVVYEQSMHAGSGQSCRGYFLLTFLGYPKIKVLHGGFAAGHAGLADLNGDCRA